MVNSTAFDTNASIGQEDRNSAKVCTEQNQNNPTVDTGKTPPPEDGEVPLVTEDNIDDEDNTVCCSVPLDKVQGVLPTSNHPKCDEPKPPTRKLLCLYCERSFASANLRSKHVERVHSVKKNRRLSSRKQQLSITPCIYCDKTDSSENTLKELFRHLVDEHSDKYFGCISCEERFLTSALLNDHHAALHPTVEIPRTAVRVAGTEDDEDSVKLTRSRVKPKLDGDNPKKITVRSKNAKLKELRSKKLTVKSSRIAFNRRESKRLQALAKLTDAQKKKNRQKPENRKHTNSNKPESLNDKANKPTSICVNPYPEFDNFYRVKKITDHSIDNLKISSLTFDDVFDKAFFNRIKCNIEENLLHHIDGKLFKNEESESRISNFEKVSSAQTEIPNSTQDNYGCELSLNAVTPIAALSLNSQFGEDFESQIEYGSKPSKKKTQTKKDEVHYKYFTRRKFQASILEHKENRDLSKLDMWTQLVIKKRQQKIIDDKKTAKEIQEYSTCDEYKNKVKKEELNRILDRRGPFEDLREEASKKAALDKLNSVSEDSISHESFTEVRAVLNEILSRVFAVTEEPEEVVEEATNIPASSKPDLREIPSFLNLRRSSSLHTDDVIDQSDKITLICSSQDTENFELPTNVARGKNELVEMSGEWARCRLYICAACGAKLPNMKYLLEHKTIYHQNVWVQHYEFVGNQSELYRHLSIPALGKVGYVENNAACKMWRRSEARTCSKCKKQCNTLGELHRHILECGGDWTWVLVRKKCKYRYGAKSRRKRRGMVLKVHHTKRKTDSTEKKKYTYNGPRQRPSDAETIQRMLADLPAKRSTRKLISLYDGVRRKQKSKALENVKQKKVKCGKVIYDRSSNIKETTEKTINTVVPRKKSQLKNKSSNVRALRSLGRVISSRILDTSTKLTVKRKLKVLNERRRTRQSIVTEKDEDASQPSKDTRKLKDVTPKRTSPRSTKIVRTLKLFTGNTNIKSFFPVKKRKVKKEVINEEEVKTKSKKKPNETEDKIEPTIEKKKKNLKKATQDPPLADMKKSASNEELELTRRKRKLKQSFRNVINRVKRLKIDNTTPTLEAVQTPIKEKPQTAATSHFLDEKEPVAKIVIPSNIEAKENIADISEIARTVIAFNHSNEDSPVPENIFKLTPDEEKNLQAKGEPNFDGIIKTEDEKDAMEPISIETCFKAKSPPMISPNLKGKIRKPARGLNDCIAMLTSKLQQKTESSSNVRSTQPKIVTDPSPQTAECILKIPTFKTHNEMEEVALDLSTKSRNTEPEPTMKLFDKESLWEFTRLTSVERIIENVVSNKFQELPSNSNSIDKTIQNVIDGHLKQQTVQIRTTVDDIIDYVSNFESPIENKKYVENLNLNRKKIGSVKNINKIEDTVKGVNDNEITTEKAIKSDIELIENQISSSKERVGRKIDFESPIGNNKPVEDLKLPVLLKNRERVRKKIGSIKNINKIEDTVKGVKEIIDNDITTEKSIKSDIELIDTQISSSKERVGRKIDFESPIGNKKYVEDLKLPLLLKNRERVRKKINKIEETVKGVKEIIDNEITTENAIKSNIELIKTRINSTKKKVCRKIGKSKNNEIEQPEKVLIETQVLDVKEIENKVPISEEKSAINIEEMENKTVIPLPILVKPVDLNLVAAKEENLHKKPIQSNQNLRNFRKQNKNSKIETVEEKNEKSNEETQLEVKDIDDVNINLVPKKLTIKAKKKAQKMKKKEEEPPNTNLVSESNIEETIQATLDATSIDTNSSLIISFKTKRKKKATKKLRFTKKKTKQSLNNDVTNKNDTIPLEEKITDEDVQIEDKSNEDNFKMKKKSPQPIKTKSISNIIKPAVLSITSILKRDFPKEEIESILPTYEVNLTSSEQDKKFKKPIGLRSKKKGSKAKRFTMLKRRTFKFLPLTGIGGEIESNTSIAENIPKEALKDVAVVSEIIYGQGKDIVAADAIKNDLGKEIVADDATKTDLEKEIVADDTAKENIKQTDDSKSSNIPEVETVIKVNELTPKKVVKKLKRGRPPKANKIPSKILIQVTVEENNEESTSTDPEPKVNNFDEESTEEKRKMPIRKSKLKKPSYEEDNSIKENLESTSDQSSESLDNLTSPEATKTRSKRTTRSLEDLNASIDQEKSFNFAHTASFSAEQKIRLTRTTKSLENLTKSVEEEIEVADFIRPTSRAKKSKKLSGNVEEIVKDSENAVAASNTRNRKLSKSSKDTNLIEEQNDGKGIENIAVIDTPLPKDLICIESAEIADTLETNEDPFLESIDNSISEDITKIPTRTRGRKPGIKNLNNSNEELPLCDAEEVSNSEEESKGRPKGSQSPIKEESSNNTEEVSNLTRISEESRPRRSKSLKKSLEIATTAEEIKDRPKSAISLGLTEESKPKFKRKTKFATKSASLENLNTCSSKDLKTSSSPSEEAFKKSNSSQNMEIELEDQKLTPKRKLRPPKVNTVDNKQEEDEESIFEDEIRHVPKRSLKKKLTKKQIAQEGILTNQKQEKEEEDSVFEDELRQVAKRPERSVKKQIEQEDNQVEEESVFEDEIRHVLKKSDTKELLEDSKVKDEIGEKSSTSQIMQEEVKIMEEETPGEENNKIKDAIIELPKRPRSTRNKNQTVQEDNIVINKEESAVQEEEEESVFEDEIKKKPLEEEFPKEDITRKVQLNEENVFEDENKTKTTLEDQFPITEEEKELQFDKESVFEDDKKKTVNEEGKEIQLDEDTVFEDELKRASKRNTKKKIQDDFSGGGLRKTRSSTNLVSSNESLKKLNDSLDAEVSKIMGFSEFITPDQKISNTSTFMNSSQSEGSPFKFKRASRRSKNLLFRSEESLNTTNSENVTPSLSESEGSPQKTQRVSRNSNSEELFINMSSESETSPQKPKRTKQSLSSSESIESLAQKTKKTNKKSKKPAATSISSRTEESLNNSENANPAEPADVFPSQKAARPSRRCTKTSEDDKKEEEMLNISENSVVAEDNSKNEEISSFNDQFKDRKENTSLEGSEIKLLEEKIRNAIRQSLISMSDTEESFLERIEDKEDLNQENIDVIDYSELKEDSAIKKPKRNKKKDAGDLKIDDTSTEIEMSTSRSLRRKSAINYAETEELKEATDDSVTPDRNNDVGSSNNEEINNSDTKNEEIIDETKIEEIESKNKDESYVLKENLIKNTPLETSTPINKKRAILKPRRGKKRLIRNIPIPEVESIELPIENVITVTNIEIPKEITIEKEPPIKIIINKHKARRKSKSIKKIGLKGHNDLYEDFALVIKKKRRAPFITFSPPDTFSKEDTYPMEVNNIPKPPLEVEKDLNESVEEMDMELDDIPIKTSIIETPTIPIIVENEEIATPKVAVKKKKGKSRINKKIEIEDLEKAEEIPILKLNLKSNDNYFPEIINGNTPMVSNNEVTNFMLDKDDFSSDDFEIDNSFEDSIMSLENNTPKQPSVDAETLFNKLIENTEFVKPLILKKTKIFRKKRGKKSIEDETSESELEIDDTLNKTPQNASEDASFEVVEGKSLYEEDFLKPVIKIAKKRKKKGVKRKPKARNEDFEDLNKNSDIIEALSEEISQIEKEESTLYSKKSWYSKTEEVAKDDIDKLYAFSETEDIELEKPIELPRRLPRKNDNLKQNEFKEDSALNKKQPRRKSKITITENVDLNFSGVFNEDKSSENEINNLTAFEGRKSLRSAKIKALENIHDEALAELTEEIPEEDKEIKIINDIDKKCNKKTKKSENNLDFSSNLFTNSDVTDSETIKEITINSDVKKVNKKQKKNENLPETFNFHKVFNNDSDSETIRDPTKDQKDAIININVKKPNKKQMKKETFNELFSNEPTNSETINDPVNDQKDVIMNINAKIPNRRQKKNLQVTESFNEIFSDEPTDSEAIKDPVNDQKDVIINISAKKPNRKLKKNLQVTESFIEVFSDEPTDSETVNDPNSDQKDVIMNISAKKTNRRQKKNLQVTESFNEVFSDEPTDSETVNDSNGDQKDVIMNINTKKPNKKQKKNENLPETFNFYKEVFNNELSDSQTIRDPTKDQKDAVINRNVKKPNKKQNKNEKLLEVTETFNEVFSDEPTYSNDPASDQRDVIMNINAKKPNRKQNKNLQVTESFNKVFSDEPTDSETINDPASDQKDVIMNSSAKKPNRRQKKNQQVTETFNKVFSDEPTDSETINDPVSDQKDFIMNSSAKIPNRRQKKNLQVTESFNEIFSDGPTDSEAINDPVSDQKDFIMNSTAKIPNRRQKKNLQVTESFNEIFSDGTTDSEAINDPVSDQKDVIMNISAKNPNMKQKKNLQVTESFKDVFSDDPTDSETINDPVSDQKDVIMNTSAKKPNGKQKKNLQVTESFNEVFSDEPTDSETTNILASDQKDVIMNISTKKPNRKQKKNLQVTESVKDVFSDDPTSSETIHDLVSDQKDVIMNISAKKPNRKQKKNLQVTETFNEVFSNEPTDSETINDSVSDQKDVIMNTSAKKPNGKQKKNLQVTESFNDVFSDEPTDSETTNILASDQKDVIMNISTKKPSRKQKKNIQVTESFKDVFSDDPTNSETIHDLVSDQKDVIMNISAKKPNRKQKKNEKLLQVTETFNEVFRDEPTDSETINDPVSDQKDIIMNISTKKPNRKQKKNLQVPELFNEVFSDEPTDFKTINDPSSDQKDVIMNISVKKPNRKQKKNEKLLQVNETFNEVFRDEPTDSETINDPVSDQKDIIMNISAKKPNRKQKKNLQITESFNEVFSDEPRHSEATIVSASDQKNVEMNISAKKPNRKQKKNENLLQVTKTFNFCKEVFDNSELTDPEAIKEPARDQKDTTMDNNVKKTNKKQNKDEKLLQVPEMFDFPKEVLNSELTDLAETIKDQIDTNMNAEPNKNENLLELSDPPTFPKEVFYEKLIDTETIEDLAKDQKDAITNSSVKRPNKKQKKNEKLLQVTETISVPKEVFNSIELTDPEAIKDQNSSEKSQNKNENILQNTETFNFPKESFDNNELTDPEKNQKDAIIDINVKKPNKKQKKNEKRLQLTDTFDFPKEVLNNDLEEIIKDQNDTNLKKPNKKQKKNEKLLEVLNNELTDLEERINDPAKDQNDTNIKKPNKKQKKNEKLVEVLNNELTDLEETINDPGKDQNDTNIKKPNKKQKKNENLLQVTETFSFPKETFDDEATNPVTDTAKDQKDAIIDRRAKKPTKKQKKTEKLLQLTETFNFPNKVFNNETPLLEDLVAELDGLEELENSIERELNAEINKEKQEPNNECSKEQLDNSTTTEENQELRRSRRGSRKVASYNENDLIDPLIDALESKRNKNKEDKAKRKLNSEELFDLLKASSVDNLFVPKQQNSFLNSLEDSSREVTDDNFDNVFENMLEKSALLTQKKGEFADNVDTDEPKVKIAKKSKKIDDIEQISISQDSTSKSDNFCEICNKSFVKLENLIKHRRTLTHIQKLSELEAKEAEKSKIISQHEDENSRESVIEPPYLPGDFEANHSLKLADIISDVLNKPVLPCIDEETNKFSDIILQNDTKRYKSLGERKSFDSETLLTSETHMTEPTKTILEKQISLLENIIENQTANNYIDDISLSSEKTDIPDSPITSTPITNNSFAKPIQYEEISEDSANLRNYDDQKLRKTLNRDEELFLECCSLLKSSSEVSSSYSSKKPKGALNLKSVDAPKWLTKADILEKIDSNAINDYSDNSRIPTPLGNSYDDHGSNSNTISSSWSMDRSADEKEEEVEGAATSFSFERVADKKNEDGDRGARFAEILPNNIRTDFLVTEKPTSHRSSTDEISDGSDNRKIMTKGARKVFEGLKVSIPTEELNMEEVLNNSPKQKKPELVTKKINEEEKLCSPTSKRKSKPVKKEVGSNLLFKVSKKKLPSPSIPKDQHQQGDKGYDVYDFEETQDNTDVFTKPNYRAFRSQAVGENDNESENESLDNTVIITSTTKKSKAQENITKKKCMIMGRIFKNAAKSKIEDIDEEIRIIPVIDNEELVENYVAECTKVIKESRVEEVINCEPEAAKPSKSDTKKPEIKKKVKQKGKKRIRTNSDSTDDEFSIGKTNKRKTNRKNAKEEDNCINLEQELKECIGVASRKSQRKCTSGKQNVLVEYWSSDDSQFEALLESKQVEIEAVPEPEVVPVMQPPPEIKKPVQKKPKKIKSQDHSVDNNSVNRRKRAAVNPLYHWSSSSEDESNDLIEVKPLREGLDEDEDRPVQHGWIVGDSPKKLVTMLAQAKGKKADIDSVKEQGKKRTNTVS